MSDFDVAVTLSNNSLNQIIATFFSRPTLRTNLFSGRRNAAIEGSNAEVAWEMRSPPTVSLAPPSADLWKHAIRADGRVADPHDNACVVSLPNFHFSVAVAGGAPAQSTLTLNAICTVVIAGQRAILTPVGIVVDLSTLSPFDQIVYTSILIPQVLAQAGGFLGSQAVPKIDFYGMSFGVPTLLVEQGRAVAAAYLAGRPGSPDRQALRAVPEGDFHVLLSREALHQVVQNGVQSLKGHTESVGGHAGFTVGSANYSASIRLDSLDAEILTPTTLHARAGVTLQASAGVDVLPEFLGQVGRGIATAGEAVGHAAGQAGGAIGHVAEQAVGAVGHAAEKAGGAIVHAFKSY